MLYMRIKKKVYGAIKNAEEVHVKVRKCWKKETNQNQEKLK